MPELSLSSEFPMPETMFHAITKNFWWCAHPDVEALAQKLMPYLGTSTYTNPWCTRKEASSAVLNEFFEDQENLQVLKDLYGRLKTILANEPKGPRTAYFCMEYGLHQSFPNYSGGLGILAGDHVKASLDAKLPMVFVGLYYRQGYFHQSIARDGGQVHSYLNINDETLPIKLARTEDGNGEPLVIRVPYGKTHIASYVRFTHVGFCPMLFLDTDCPENPEEFRSITDRLYAGDRSKRLAQELVLGIGGYLALKALDITCQTFHLNEGHAAFLQFARISDDLNSGLSWDAAVVRCAASSVFTTHTPVPAGNEVFGLPILDKALRPVCDQQSVPWVKFVTLGLQPPQPDGKRGFCLTTLALKTSKRANGVSELHGQVASRMWSHLWPGVHPWENPIQHITNGVHVRTWMGTDLQALLQQQLGINWQEQLAGHDCASKIAELSEVRLSEVRTQAKARLLDSLAKFLPRDYTESYGVPQISPNTLVIGFARRFATYKRANLIFRDQAKLASILANASRPVCFLFAGKAHPDDKDGQGFIQEIYQLSKQPEFCGKILVLASYEMSLGKLLVQGCDVWLNNPRRPFEASGTSGQKVSLNAGVNFSVCDGWWRECYTGANGFAIGRQKDYSETMGQDSEDAADFYQCLGEQIIPEYFERPQQWMQRAKASLASAVYSFSAARMVHDYSDKMYKPSALAFQSLVDIGSQSLEAQTHANQKLQNAWQLAQFVDVKWTGSVIRPAVPDSPRPLHFTDFDFHSSAPGKIFEGAKGRIELEFYHGELNPTDFCLELVACQEGDLQPQTLQIPWHDAPSEGSLGGIVRYCMEFDFSRQFAGNNAPVFVRLRALPQLAGTVHKQEAGHVLWF